MEKREIGGVIGMVDIKLLAHIEAKKFLKSKQKIL